MLDPLIRPLKDAVLEPLARAAGDLHPVAITLASLVAGLACATAAATGAYGVAALLWAANRTLDGLDGVVARRTGRQSDLGGYLDLVTDFVVYAAVPLGVAVSAAAAGTPVWAACALMLAAFYVNAAAWMVLSAVLEKRAAGAARNGESTSITMPEGLIAGTETVLAYFAFLLLPAAAGPLFTAMAALVALTALQRVTHAVRRLR